MNMDWLRENRRMVTPVLATLALPVLLFFYTAGQLLALRADYQEQVERLEPRIARLQGLLEYEEALGEAAATVGEDVTDLVYPAHEDAAAVAAGLQKNLRELFADAGMTVSNSQIVPPRGGERFDRVAVKLTVAGDLPALDVALSGLSSREPRLLVESLDVWPARQRRDKEAQTVTATVQVLALRVRA